MDEETMLYMEQKVKMYKTLTERKEYLKKQMNYGHLLDVNLAPHGQFKMTNLQRSKIKEFIYSLLLEEIEDINLEIKNL